MPDDAPRKGENWKPLRWRCGLIQVDARYQISNQGRLKSPFTGAVTEGFAAFGTRWTGVRESGILVDLLVASGKQGVHMPPSIRSAYDALISGHTVEDQADGLGIGLSTSWSYMSRAAQYVLAHDLRVVVQRLVPPELWQTLLRLRGDKRLGGSLNELWDV
eukprot:6783935-Prymnesium_polylepis.1